MGAVVEPCNVFGVAYKSEGTIDLSVSGSLSASIRDDDFGNLDSDQASYTYSPPQPPTLTLEKHNGDNRDRSLCLTSGAGEAAAYQCGDLLVTHAMPAYATKGRDRSLTLLYNSDQAAPRAVVTAELGMEAPHNPDEIEVKLWLDADTLATATYDSVSWSGQSYQLSIGFDASNPATWPSGLYPFELTARAIYDSTVDLAVTGVRYLTGDATGEELSITAAGAAVGLVAIGGGAGRAGRRAFQSSRDALASSLPKFRGGRLQPTVDPQ